MTTGGGGLAGCVTTVDVEGSLDGSGSAATGCAPPPPVSRATAIAMSATTATPAPAMTPTRLRAPPAPVDLPVSTSVGEAKLAGPVPGREPVPLSGAVAAALTEPSDGSEDCGAETAGATGATSGASARIAA